MRCIRYFSIIFLFALLFTACGTDTSNNWSQEDMQRLAQWLVKRPDGRIVLSPSTPNNNFNPNGGDTPTLVETGDPSNFQQILVTGTVAFPQFQDGSFLIEARGTRNCDKGLCPDMEAIPASAVTLQSPGYFSLVVPHDGQTIFAVATYKAPDGSSEQKDVYLGALENRADGVNFDFGTAAPSQADPSI